MAALAGVPAAERTARFRSVLVLADPAGPRKSLQIVVDFNLAERRQLSCRFERILARRA